MNLATAFEESTQRHRNSSALFWGESELTYQMLHAGVCTASSALQNLFRVKEGDRVAVWLRNCPEFASVALGVLWAGGTLVPINSFLKSDEVLHILDDAEIDVLISEEATREQWIPLLPRRPTLKVLTVEELAVLPQNASRPNTNRRPEDLAIIIYTSGTTGRPKGAMLTHANLLANVESCRQTLQVGDTDRIIVLLPLFHSFMLTVGLLLPLLVGGAILLIRSLHPAKHTLQEIMLRGGTILPAIPQFFRTLASAGVPPGFPVRVCISGAAPLPGEILREFTEKVPGTPLLEGYGLSEASPVVSMNPIKGPWKAGSIGVPIPDVEVTVQDDAGQVLGPGATGELCVRGANVMVGYWNQPEETAKVLMNGWLRTGDIGHRDVDGYLYISDRKKDMLLVNGINVYPREIEDVIYQYPGVKEAAVVGLHDPRRGEMPVAFVVANEGVSIDEHEVVAFLRNKLADYKVPRKVVNMAALPRNATGKVLKRELRRTTL